MPAVTVVFGGRKIGTHQMRTSPFVVGRDASCGVHIDNAGVSRRHCQFVLENGCYYVEDAGSSNGTFLKGNRVTRAPVENGDEVNIGKFVLVFENNLMELLSSGEPSSAAGAPASAPPSGGAPSRGAVPGGDAMLTFKMDPETLRRQMAKAGAAAATVSNEVRRAGDIGADLDPDAPLVIKRRKSIGSFIFLVVKVLGFAIIGAGILTAILYAISLSSS